MDVPQIPAFKHVLSQCPCGHGTHIARGLHAPDSVVCEECDALAGMSAIKGSTVTAAILTVVSLDFADAHAIQPGMSVRYAGRMLTIAGVEPIALLDGRLPSYYARLLLVGRINVEEP